MRSARLILILGFVLAKTGLAEWQVVHATGEPSAESLVIHRHITVTESQTGERAVVDLAIFSSKSCTLRVIENKNGETNLAEAVKSGGCVAGVNGGYFDAEFQPIGLRIIKGKTISLLKRAKLLTGVLEVTPHQSKIVRSSEFSMKQKLLSAIQCGPFLVDADRRVRGLNDSRPARRTFALITRGNRAALGVCSEITLAQLAEILATLPLIDDLKTARALNLDGGSSTGFWFARENGDAFSISEQKPVRDFVAIAPK